MDKALRNQLIIGSTISARLGGSTTEGIYGSNNILERELTIITEIKDNRETVIELVLPEGDVDGPIKNGDVILMVTRHALERGHKGECPVVDLIRPESITSTDTITDFLPLLLLGFSLQAVEIRIGVPKFLPIAEVV